MDYFVLMIFLTVSVLAIIVIRVVLARRDRKGISKDDAERILMRRYLNIRIVGARFTSQAGRPIWEFDVVDRARIFRIAVDAQTAKIISAVPAHSSQVSAARETRMFGKSVGY